MVSETKKRKAEFLLGLVRGMKVQDLMTSFNLGSLQAVYNKVNRSKGLIFKRNDKYLLTAEGKKLVLATSIVSEKDSSLYPIFQHNVWVYFRIIGRDMIAFQDYVKLLFDKAGVNHTPNHIKGVWSYYFKMWDLKCRVGDDFFMVHPKPRVCNTVQEAINYSNGVAWDVAERIEKFFGVVLDKGFGIKLCYKKQEYALLETEIAKLYIQNRERMKIVDQDGKVRILIDFSDRVPHFEAVHQLHSPVDAEYFQKHFGDLCVNKPPMVSEIVERIEMLEKKVL